MAVQVSMGRFHLMVHLMVLYGANQTENSPKPKEWTEADH